MLSANVKPQPTMQKSFFCQKVSNTLVDELNYDRNCFINLILKYYRKSLEINYNPYNPRTFIKLCARSVNA
jgi:hypothetical protein